jgi:hypothetical protein
MKDSVHSGTTQNMTFEAWLKKENFKAQVILPFKEYLKVAFCEYCCLHIWYHYLLSTADDSAARKVMAHVQGASKVDNDTVLPPLV